MRRIAAPLPLARIAAAVTALIVGGALAAAATGVPSSAIRTTYDPMAAGRAIAYDLGSVLSRDGRLTDTRGRAVAPGDFAGHIVLMHVVTARCPSLCAVRALDMSWIANALPPTNRADLRLVAIDLNDADTARDLEAYADGLRLDPQRWSLLVSTDRQATGIAIALGLAPPDARPLAPGQEPPTTLFLFDRRGHLMQRYGGRPVDRGRIAREIVELGRYDDQVAAHPSSHPASN